jgi:hypothetical protein
MTSSSSTSTSSSPLTDYSLVQIQKASKSFKALQFDTSLCEKQVTVREQVRCTLDEKNESIDVYVEFDAFIEDYDTEYEPLKVVFQRAASIFFVIDSVFYVDNTKLNAIKDAKPRLDHGTCDPERIPTYTVAFEKYQSDLIKRVVQSTHNVTDPSDWQVVDIEYEEVAYCGDDHDYDQACAHFGENVEEATLYINVEWRLLMKLEHKNKTKAHSDTDDLKVSEASSSSSSSSSSSTQ